MASVSELLAAAEAKKSPFLKFLEGAADGYSSAQNKSLDRTEQLIKIENMRRQQQAQDEMAQRAQQMIADQQESAVKEGFSMMGKKPAPFFPHQKLSEKLTRNARGEYSQSFETVSPKQEDEEMRQARLELIRAQRDSSNRAGKPRADAVEKVDSVTRRAVESVTASLKNKFYVDDIGDVEIKTRKDAVKLAITKGIDPDKYPAIKALVDSYPSEDQTPKKSSFFDRVKSSITGPKSNTGTPREYSSAEEVEKANLPDGTVVSVGGKKFTVRR